MVLGGCVVEFTQPETTSSGPAEGRQQDLRSKEMVGARRAERRQARVRRPADEVEHHVAVRVVTGNMGAIGRHETADQRQQRRRAGAALRLG